MSRARVAKVGVCVGFLFVISSVHAPPARAAWVNSTATQFQVGGKIIEIVPTATNTPFVDPTCGSQGGTSLALVRGSKVPGITNAFLYPVVLVVSCLDNGSSASIRSRLNFLNPVTLTGTGGTVITAAGQVIQQMSTLIGGVVAAPSNGWAHLVLRPDKGDILGCGSDGSLYTIDYSHATNNNATATLIPPVSLASGQAPSSCAGLAWDAEADMIYQGLTVNGGNKIGEVIRFTDGTTAVDKDFINLPCAANGLSISGGVLLMSCSGSLAMQRLDKSTGTSLGVFPTVTATGLTSLNNDPGLGDLGCDPVTFQRDPSQTSAINPLGRDLYRDTMWSRRGSNGNGVAGLEFPPFTCGLPSKSVVVQNGVSFSPLAAGFSTGSSTSPGSSPLSACFDGNGIVIDSDGDGLPDCWEANKGGSAGSGGIDFDGDGTKDFTLCAQVNTNGDGTTLTTECADPSHKDLFVEAAWMQYHQPDPQALSQTQSVATVGVRSVREAFGAAPVSNPALTNPNGISIHIQVDKQAVTFLNFTKTTLTSHVTNVALTPCTGPASLAPSTSDAADYDAIKAANFGVFDAASPPSAKAVNAMRLALRYVLFAHNLVGSPSGGSSSSGCSEVAGDDAVVSLGSFTTTTVNGISHARGTTDQQAGTFMHEFGHLLGFQHGGEDVINNKPNYRSVMSYTRQFSGSPITSRRLDYSRSEVDLNEASLNECSGIAADPSLGPIAPYFSSNDQIAFGPGAWSIVTPLAATVSSPCLIGQFPINWNRQTSQGKVFQTATSGDINGDGVISTTTLFGSNDWANVLYRLSAAIDFAGGRSESPVPPGSNEMTKEDETAFFLMKDVDGNGIGDATDCGGTISTGANGVATIPFPCTHRIDIKPSASFPKTINLGTEANVTIAIFSETNTDGTQVWRAPTEVIINDQVNFPLTFSIGTVVEPVKTNQSGQGTCSVSDVADPITGVKDGIKDLKCQFGTSGLPAGTNFGVVSGYFLDSITGQTRAFDARQEVTILP